MNNKLKTKMIYTNLLFFNRLHQKNCMGILYQMGEEAPCNFSFLASQRSTAANKKLQVKCCMGKIIFK